MENAGLIMEVEPLHVVKIIVHITENLEEQHHLNFVAAQENDQRLSAVSFSPMRCHRMFSRSITV